MIKFFVFLTRCFQKLSGKKHTNDAALCGCYGSLFWSIKLPFYADKAAICGRYNYGTETLTQSVPSDFAFDAESVFSPERDCTIT